LVALSVCDCEAATTDVSHYLPNKIDKTSLKKKKKFNKEAGKL
jgi:hypothetical protein